MKEFAILDRHLDIHRHYLLEASAGTGKTFSIENLVARLLLEEPQRNIEEILIVTFTKAATRDVKLRVRATIERAIRQLDSPDAPDYLQAIEDRTEARRRLERALFCFDRAQIFTIHGFCQRMLTELGFTAGIAPINDEGQLPEIALLGVIRDFFRTEVCLPRYHWREVESVWKEHRRSHETLERALMTLLRDGRRIAPQPSFEENRRAFEALIAPWSGLELYQAFETHSKGFNGLRNRKREIKEEVKCCLDAFARLMDQKQVCTEEFSNVLTMDLEWLDKFINPPLSTFRAQLLALISPHAIFARMAADCKALLKRKMEEEETFRFDDLLSRMRDALAHEAFVERIRERYSAAIVDEFQDTDPLQWEIFQRIFLSKQGYQGHLYLVGDPKQSIYAFRNADIYTYLQAKEALGEEHLAYLTTNFRSETPR